ncbi:MAG: integrase arm-type DNA-binding domain-containing protein [Pseudomonas marincola]
MKTKLTKRTVDAIEPLLDKEIFVWDTETRGFGLRVKPSGTKTFIIQYRNERGKTRRYAIGQHGRMTVEQARKHAKIKLAETEIGQDPSAIRKEATQIRSVEEMCRTYFEEASAGRVLRRGQPKKASTLATDKGRIERHIVPMIGKKAIDELTRHDVETFMFDIRDGKTAKDVRTGPRGRALVKGGPGTAAKAVSLLSAIYNYAIGKEWVAHNPCQGIEKPADKRRDRFLSKQEYIKIGEAIVEAERTGANKTALRAVTALMLTGCRKNEILSLRYKDVDVEGRCLRLPDTKTGKQIRPCGVKVLKFLTQEEGDPDEYLFTAYRGNGHLINVAKPIARICNIAEVEGVTAHVFRHSFATVAHELNYSELTIAGLLGHSLGSITARYAHHVDHALADAASNVSAEIFGRLNKQESIQKG